MRTWFDRYAAQAGALALGACMMVVGSEASAQQGEPRETTADPSPGVDGPAEAADVVAEQEPDGRACDVERMRRLAAQARATVESPYFFSQGFLYEDQQHVIAPFFAVAEGYGLLVTVGGETRSAQVVAWDEDADVALLQLSAPVQGATPLLSTTRAFELGDEVYGVGLREDTQDVVVGARPIVAVSPDHLIAGDGVTHYYDWRYGMPLLDCDSNVAGLVVDGWGGRAVKAEVLDRLSQSRVAPGEYTPDWRLGMAATVSGQYDGSDGWLGGRLELSAVADETWELPFGVGVHALLDAPAQGSYPQRQDMGIRVETQSRIGYRLRLNDGFPGVFIVPSIGAALQYEHRWTRTYDEVVTGGPCTPQEPCRVERTSEVEDDGGGFRVMPVAGASLRLFVFDLGYQFKLDPRSPEDSIHEFGLGAAF